MLPNVFNIFKIRILSDDRMLGGAGLRASPLVLSTWPLQKYFSHPTLVIYFCATARIKLKLRLQIGGRLLIAKKNKDFD